MDDSENGPVRPRSGGAAADGSEAGATSHPATVAHGSRSGARTGAPGGNPESARPRRRKRRRGRRPFIRDQREAPGQSAAPPAAGASAPVPAAAPAGNGTRRPRPSANHDGRTYAALDLGTNNCRLLIAVPTRPGQFRVIDAFSRIVRLGEGLHGTGRLCEAAMQRSIEALKVCASKLAARPGGRMRLIATEACRVAANGRDFLDEVRRVTGLELEIADRQTEARLAVAGCSSLVERGTRGVVLFDIGGGSSEIVLIDLTRGVHGRQLTRNIVGWTSLPVGVVSLAEQFGGREVGPQTFEAMIAEVMALLERFDQREALNGVVASPGFHLLGTSGTVTTLAGLHLGLERYDRRRVDGLWLSDRETDEIVRKLMGWTFEQRVANACIGADRADLVLAGCAILEAIRRTWPAPRLRVADRGLREGMLIEMMAADGAWRRNRPRSGAARGVKT